MKRLKDYVDFQTISPPQSINCKPRKGKVFVGLMEFSNESVDLTSAENYITSEVVINKIIIQCILNNFGLLVLQVLSWLFESSVFKSTNHSVRSDRTIFQSI